MRRTLRHTVGALGALLVCLFVPSAGAVVCNFDDLPAPPAGGLGNIPQGYCGINWIGEGAQSTVPYFNGTFQFSFLSGREVHVLSPHSAPNALALASSFVSFSFGSAVVGLST